jgi:SMC interacting uncharacterized protein involved in chromosome segregation
MTKLEEMKKKAELARLEAGKAEMEFKKMEYLENIERLDSNLEIQEQAIKKIKEELNS